MCCTNDLCGGTRRRVEWMLIPVDGTLGGGGPVGWPRMNLEMHLHLNSELASNEFLTEFAFKIRKMPSGFALVRQCREQATASRTHASMSVRGHTLHRNPENIGTVAQHSNPENIGTVAQHWAGKIHVRRNKFHEKLCF